MRTTNNELTTGIVQHPVTGLWQTWISFTGNDIQCITAHANPDDADRVAKQIANAWSEGKYKTQQIVIEHLHKQLEAIG
ncbi:hypothetical protein [uncultured Nostoc sp.]|uniref:hypothetical protein n=1 Tax=uncultured Nostoc sp. TaxID=340711 RepID=UPI0035CA2F7A